jgi:hypothetical protein
MVVLDKNIKKPILCMKTHRNMVGLRMRKIGNIHHFI